MPACLRWINFLFAKKKRDTVSSQMVKPLFAFLFWGSFPGNGDGNTILFAICFDDFVIFTIQAHYTNLPVATFLQNCFMLLLAIFATLSKWSIVSGIKSAEVVLSKTENHESGNEWYVHCCTYRGSWEMKWVIKCKC